MAVQTAAPANLAPWWTTAKCRAHQPYPTPSAARRAVELHPISVRFCPKCAEGFAIEAFRCHSDPSHWHAGHGRRIQETVMTAPATPRKGATAPKLTREQARWVYTLRGAVSSNEAARRSGACRRTVRGIWDGELYAWATADLRAVPIEETPVQITTPPTVIETKRDDEYQTMKDALVMHPTRDVVPVAALIADMADAIDVLLAYHGAGLPKFMTLDTDAIRALVAQARAAS